MSPLADVEQTGRGNKDEDTNGKSNRRHTRTLEFPQGTLSTKVSPREDSRPRTETMTLGTPRDQIQRLGVKGIDTNLRVLTGWSSMRSLGEESR